MLRCVAAWRAGRWRRGRTGIVRVSVFRSAWRRRRRPGTPTRRTVGARSVNRAACHQPTQSSRATSPTRSCAAGRAMAPGAVRVSQHHPRHPPRPATTARCISGVIHRAVVVRLHGSCGVALRGVVRGGGSAALCLSIAQPAVGPHAGPARLRPRGHPPQVARPTARRRARLGVGSSVAHRIPKCSNAGHRLTCPSTRDQPPGVLVE